MSSNDESEIEEVPQELMFGHMLDSIMSKHFEYVQDNNNLSMAEILLLIKQSIDTQNTILLDMLKLKKAKYEQKTKTK